MASRDIREEQQAPVAAPTEQAPLPSIQLQIGEDIQRAIVDMVIDDYEVAKQQRGARHYGTTAKGEKLDFDKWMKALRDIYSGDRHPKDVPWKFCSNRSLRIATSILEMIHARIFPGVWNEDLIRWKPGGVEDVPKSERITKFMKWWVVVHSQMREFFDKWTKYTSGFGDSLTESYWDVKERITGEMEETPVTDEMGQPLTNQDGSPALQKSSRIERIEKTATKILKKDEFFMLDGSRDIQEDPVIIHEEIAYKDLEAMERKGLLINVTEKLKKMMVVSGIPENVDPIEAERLRNVKLRNMRVKVVREYMKYDVDGSGIEDNVRVYVSPDHRIYLGGVSMRHITKSGKRPLDFTKYMDRLNEIDELWGEGVIEQVRELAEEIDAIFNQISDANTLGILKPGFYDPSGDLDAPNITLAPNKMVPVTDPQKNVYFPPIDIPTERLILALRLVLEFIERLTAASSYVMGKESEIVGGSGTATRTQAIVQSAEIRFSRPTERLKEGAGRILTTHLDLIQLNIPPGLENRVLGEKGEPIFQAGELTDQGISGKFDAFIANDPTMGSKATERELAAMIYAQLIMNPIVGTDASKIYEITADLVKANLGPDHVQRILGPAPQTDAIDDPEDENTLIVQGDFQRVKPVIYENHLYHIQKHTELMQSPSMQLLAQTAPALAQQVMQYLQQHIMEHQQMMQIMVGMMQKFGSAGKSGPGGKGDTQSGKDGTQSGTTPANQAAPGQLGMDNMSGPMGQALQTQRKGESG